MKNIIIVIMFLGIVLVACGPKQTSSTEATKDTSSTSTEDVSLSDDATESTADVSLSGDVTNTVD